MARILVSCFCKKCKYRETHLKAWVSWRKRTGGSGISWTICKSFALCFRQITTPAPHHLIFYRPDALCEAQLRAWKHWRKYKYKMILNANLCWIVCRFRAATDTGRPPESSVSPKKTKSDRRRTNNSKLTRGGNASSEAAAAGSVSALEAFIASSLPAHVTIKDPSLDVLALLRLLHGLSCHWNTLFDASSHKLLVLATL